MRNQRLGNGNQDGIEEHKVWDGQNSSFEHQSSNVADERGNEDNKSDETIESDIADEDQHRFANEREPSLSNYN